MSRLWRVASGPFGPVGNRAHPAPLRAAAAAPLLVAGLLTASCGGNDETATIEQEPAATEEQAAEGQENAEAANEESSSADPAAAGLCATVTSVDLTAAFDDMLTFGEAQGTGARAFCTVPVDGAEGEGLLVQVSTEDSYQARRDLEQQDVPFEEIDDLGAEAFIINEANLNVLLADGTAVQVAIQAFFVQNEPPPPEVVQDGLVTVAEAVVDSL